MGKSSFIKTNLLLFPALIFGMAVNEASAQTKPTKLKSIMVLEHGTSGGHRASSDHLNAILRDLGTTHGFTVKVLAQSVNLDVEFSTTNLANYQVVILSNNDGVHRFIAGTARNNFQAYVENGGGLLAVHAASAFITGWTWLDNALVAKFYNPHQSNGPSADLKQDAEGLKTETETRGIAMGLTAPLAFIDEYYQFESSPRGKTGVTVLLTVVEASSSAPFSSPMGADHPVTWAKPIGKGRIVHNSLGHSFGEKQHNVYTQKTNYLKNFTYTALRYAAGDFLGCMDEKYKEFHADYTKSDATACKELKDVSMIFDKNGKQGDLPLVSQNETGTLLKVEFFKEGPNAIAISDISGKLVYQKNGSGQSSYTVPTPKRSGIYIVKAMAGGKVSTHRVTVL